MGRSFGSQIRGAMLLAGLAAAVAVTYVLAPTYLWLAIGLAICAGAISAILAFVFQDDTLSLSDAQIASERTFTDESNSRQPFGDLNGEAELWLSVVVPAYNEHERLPGMLQESTEWLQQELRRDPSHTWEVIVVDDGSKSPLVDAVAPFVAQFSSDRVRLMELSCNQGKGGAVRKGIQAARGQLIYMADADSAAKMIEFSKLDTCMKRIETDGYGVAIGSRAHLQDESQAQRKWYRTILMHGFHALVKVVGGVHGVQDTQCGYKLFTRASAREVFSNVHVRRWAFDVEVLRLVQKLEIPLQEVAIVWHDADGSKMTLKGMVNMARDLFRIRYRYTLGHWQFPKSVMRK